MSKPHLSKGAIPTRVLLAMPVYDRARATLGRDIARARRSNYAHRKYNVELDLDTPVELRLRGADSRVTWYVEQAECLADVRGEDLIERVLSTHLSQLVPIESPSSPFNTDLDIIDWSRLDREKLEAELDGRESMSIYKSRKRPTERTQTTQADWLHVDQVAQRLGISVAEVHTLITKGTIAPAAVRGEHIDPAFVRNLR